jgi:hypothetical protein
MNHAFTLEVSGIDTGRENYEDALYEAGCDDALIAVVNNTMFLDFHRDGLSFEDAVKSACITRRRACRGQGSQGRTDPGLARLTDTMARLIEDLIQVVEYLDRLPKPVCRVFGRLDGGAAAIVTVALSRLADGNTSNLAAIREGAAAVKIDRGPGYRIYFRVG